MKLHLLMLTLMPLFLMSCTLGPSHFERVAENGTMTSFTTTGITVLTKSDYENSTVTKGDFSATHTTVKKNEVGVPMLKATEALGGAVINEIAPTVTTITGGN